MELAQREFPNFEVLVATHIDTDHLHSHLIVNSVSFLDGKKLHQSAAGLQAHRTVNDEICAAHGLAILPPPERQVERKRMSSREYRSAAKGESRKFRLMNTIDQCMRYASTKEEFLSLMESEGYRVHWTDGRKNITYTTPTGMKCRDDRLHETKYTKEVMEHEFRIRAEIVSGGIEGAERSADYDTAGLSQQGGVTGVAPSGWTSWSGTRRPTQPFCGRFPAGRNCTPPRSSWRHCRGGGGQMCTELKRAGRKKEISILPPGLDTALSVPAWLLLLGTLVGMVTLRAIFPNPKQELLPGMYVRAILNEGVDDQAILLPQRALLRDAKGNPTTYVVNAENKVEIRPLKVGRTQGNSWVVLDGLKAGDKVIVEGLQKIRPGSPVRIAEPTPVKQGAPASEKR